MLYLRGEDTHLFDIAPMPEVPVAPTRPVRRKAARGGDRGRRDRGRRGRRALLLLRPALGAPGTANGGQPVMKEVTVPVDQAWTETGVFCAANARSQRRRAQRQATSTSTAAGRGTRRAVTSGELFESRVTGTRTPHRSSGRSTRSPNPFFVGYAARYECPVDGFLLLGINDKLAGNRGEFSAAVTYTPPQ